MEFASVYAAMGGGAVTWAGQSIVAAIKARNDISKHETTTARQIDQHRDKLTFDLLQAAREEVAAARREAGELRILQARLYHFDEALEHISALLEAQRSGEGGALAARQARLFLARIRQFKEVVPDV